MTQQEFEIIKNSPYVHDGSFAIWRGCDRAGICDLTLFNESDTWDKLHSDVVFVALNPAERDGDPTVGQPFGNFHSADSNQKDFKLCHALKETSYEGAYITDLFKGLRETDSSVVAREYAKNSANVEMDIQKLKDELAQVSPSRKPVLIAVGGEAEKHLKKHLGEEYLVWKITHYSDYKEGISGLKEDYRKTVQAQLDELDKIRKHLDGLIGSFPGGIRYVPFGRKQVRKSQNPLPDGAVILIPDSVTSITKNAFDGEPHHPIHIIYTGTASQWNAVKVPDSIKTTLCVHRTDGTEHTGSKKAFDESREKKILILGTAPGVSSLNSSFYYQDPRNRFWDLLAKAFNEDVPVGINKQKEFLIKHGISLWDVIKECDRDGSLDKDIKNAVPNEIGKLEFSKIFCNGQKGKGFATGVFSGC